MKLWTYPTFEESHRRALTKSAIWRILGIVVLTIITYAFTRSLFVTSLITILHHGVFIFGYYAQERFWTWTAWLDGSKWKPFARIFLYEIVAANIVLGIISFAVTKSLQQMTTITQTYTLNKYWMFYAYDYVWSKVRWQTKQLSIPT